MDKHIKNNWERIRQAISVFNRIDRENKIEFVDDNDMKYIVCIHDKPYTEAEKILTNQRLNNLIGFNNILEIAEKSTATDNLVGSFHIILNVNIDRGKWKLKHSNRLGNDTQDMGPGLLVKTKRGNRGVLYHSSTEINGKVPVYLDNGLRMLCTKSSLKLIGYVD